MAREHVLAAENITQKGRLFMWKLGELKKARLGGGVGGGTNDKVDDRVEDGE